MKKLRRIFALGLVIIMVVFATGCANEDKKIIDALDLSKIESFEYTAENTVSMSVLGQSMNVEMDMEGIQFTDPEKGHVKVSKIMTGEAEETAEFYYEVDSDKVLVYSENGDEWEMDEVDYSDYKEEYSDLSTYASFSEYMQYASDFKNVGKKN
ncbi:MAG: hypothetical protein ACOX3W_06965 [Christensenellaceae bacterium]